MYFMYYFVKGSLTIFILINFPYLVNLSVNSSSRTLLVKFEMYTTQPVVNSK